MADTCARCESNRTLVQRLRGAEGVAAEQGFILDAVRAALAGEPVSDFAASFTPVQATLDLVAERDALAARVRDVEAILHSRGIVG